MVSQYSGNKKLACLFSLKRRCFMSRRKTGSKHCETLHCETLLLKYSTTTAPHVVSQFFFVLNLLLKRKSKNEDSITGCLQMLPLTIYNSKSCLWPLSDVHRIVYYVTTQQCEGVLQGKHNRKTYSPYSLSGYGLQ